MTVATTSVGRFSSRGETVPAEVFSGEAPEDILTAMKADSMFTDDMTLDEYIEHLIGSAREWAGVELRVCGGTESERCRSVLEGALAAGLLVEVDGTQLPMS